MILYFSGTGNTRLASVALGKLLNQEARRLPDELLRQPDAGTLPEPPEGDGLVIWAFPTYAWGLPPVVERLIRRAAVGRAMGAVTHCMLATCGDDMGRADRRWRAVMRRRGLRTAGAYAVRMPNTYTLLPGFDVDPPELAAAKLAAMGDRLRAIAASIAAGGPDLLLPGAWAAFKSAVLGPLFRRFLMSARPFRATAGCTGCATCARLCPMGNIGMNEEGTPRWGADCAMCLRCYHACPRRAIAYGHATDAKGQYLAPEDDEGKIKE